MWPLHVLLTDGGGCAANTTNSSMKKLKRYLRMAGIVVFILLSGFGAGIDPNLFKPRRIFNDKEVRTEQIVKKEEDSETSLQEIKK